MTPELRPLLSGLFFLTMASLAAQPAGVNTDEAKVPAYSLPDPLLAATGRPITNAAEWETLRRPEILNLFSTHVYGHTPSVLTGYALSFHLLETDSAALDGLATRRQVRLAFTSDPAGPALDLLLYLPNAHPGPVPIFLGLNFQGNHTIHSDPGILLSTAWIRSTYPGVVANRATEAARGAASSRWPVETILARGYGLATAYYGDLEPDHPEGWKQGIRGAFSPNGQATVWTPSDWGAIAAWAWGLSRALDYLATDPAVHASRVALLGHSRLGKAALWAGASDPRFALVISNNSGCGGAALSRRAFGETVARINTSFPHWFCGRFHDYNDRESALPIDQHQLISLLAPRPAYIASAAEDLWADPTGEFLSALHAGPVYALYGQPGLDLTSPPPVDHPVGARLGYHRRSGKHDLTAYDWACYLDFADRHLR